MLKLRLCARILGGFSFGGIIMFLRVPTIEAHPLQSEPVNHPYVFGFDQFYLSEDPDEHLAQGGLLLLAELRCTACHQPPAAWSRRLDPAPGPDLSWVGSRMVSDSLWRLVRSPQHSKKGTLMPGLFTGEDGDAEDVEAIVEFLTSRSRPRSEMLQMPKGNPTSGKQLYHRIGCVACHEPATDYRPPAPPEGTEIEKPGLASVPLVLAEAYTEDELAAFLQNPLHIKPSGRMPSQHLTSQEAADIAAYLQVGEVFEPSIERSVLQIPKQGVDRGKSVFMQRNCQACHPLDGIAANSIFPTPLINLNAKHGCLSEARQSGVPFYQLNPTQRRALELSLRLVQNHPNSPLSYDALDWKLSRLNCYACHDRDGKGGPEDPRAQYFSETPLPSTPGFHPYPLPRSLDGLEKTLTDTELLNSLRGKPTAEGETTLRMPDFGPKNAAELFELFRYHGESR